MTTELIYLSEMSQLEAEARVETIEHADGQARITLDRTVFYPQGGGQPHDIGTIRGEAATVVVDSVRWEDGRVVHSGPMRGKLAAGDEVALTVDGERRATNTRLHSAGHVIDMAIDRLGLGWIPGKGFHFPDGPYVEYSGELSEDKEVLMKRIEEEAQKIVEEGHRTRVEYVALSELPRLCRFVPSSLPARDEVRVVTYGSFGVACGGTHVRALSETGEIHVRKLKSKGGTIRVSYSLR